MQQISIPSLSKIKEKILNHFRILVPVAIIGAISLSGCVSSASSKNMTIEPQTSLFQKSSNFDERLISDVTVATISGGTAENSHWTRADIVNNDSFRAAFESSLRNQGLYSKFGQYEISADLAKLEQIGNFSTTMNVEIEYSLTNRETRKTIMRKKVSSSHSMKLGEALIGARRGRLVTEGVIRKNIENFLVELSQVEL